MPRALVQTSLLTESRRFERGLVTRQNPGFLRPLGHAVTATAPTGIIRDLIALASAPRTIEPVSALPTPSASAAVPRVQRLAQLPRPGPPLIVSAPELPARPLPVAPAPDVGAAHAYAGVPAVVDTGPDGAGADALEAGAPPAEVGTPPAESRAEDVQRAEDVPAPGVADGGMGSEAAVGSAEPADTQMPAGDEPPSPDQGLAEVAAPAQAPMPSWTDRIAASGGTDAEVGTLGSPGWQPGAAPAGRPRQGGAVAAQREPASGTPPETSTSPLPIGPPRPLERPGAAEQPSSGWPGAPRQEGSQDQSGADPAVQLQRSAEGATPVPDAPLVAARGPLGTPGALTTATPTGGAPNAPAGGPGPSGRRAVRAGLGPPLSSLPTSAAPPVQRAVATDQLMQALRHAGGASAPEPGPTGPRSASQATGGSTARSPRPDEPARGSVPPTHVGAVQRLAVPQGPAGGPAGHSEHSAHSGGESPGRAAPGGAQPAGVPSAERDRDPADSVLGVAESRPSGAAAGVGQVEVHWPPEPVLRLAPEAPSAPLAPWRGLGAAGWTREPLASGSPAAVPGRLGVARAPDRPGEAPPAGNSPTRPRGTSDLPVQLAPELPRLPARPVPPAGPLPLGTVVAASGGPTRTGAPTTPAAGAGGSSSSTLSTAAHPPDLAPSSEPGEWAPQRWVPTSIGVDASVRGFDLPVLPGPAPAGQPVVARSQTIGGHRSVSVPPTGGPAPAGQAGSSGEPAQSASASGPASAGSQSQAGPSGPSSQSAGETAIALGIGQRAPDGSVVFVVPPEEAGNAAPGESPQPPAPAESGAGPTPAGAGAASTVGTQAATGGQQAPAGQSGDRDSEDLEALAVRLYPRISRQIRLELTRERDRLGALTDFRH